MTATELQILLDIFSRQEPVESPGVAQLRANMNRLADFLPVLPGTTRQAVDAGGVPAEFIAAPGADAARVVLYFHGGGYVLGSIDTHVALVSRLSAASGARALAAAYRLAPENPYPAAVEDAIVAYRWLLGQGADPARTVIAGDSAGGGLTVALRDAGDPLPAAALCISPWTDLEGTGESMRTMVEADPIFEPGLAERLAAWYLDGADPRAPLASPLHADLSGLPPLLVQVGGREILRDDSRRLVERAKAAGVDAVLDEWPEMIHVWQLFAHMLSEGGEAIDRAGAFIRDRTG